MSCISEEKIEQAFWDFDAKRSKSGMERDAFKHQIRGMLRAAGVEIKSESELSLSAIDFLEKSQQHMLDRAKTYDADSGERSMSKTVAVFNLYHGTALTEQQGWHFMQILKDVRLFSGNGFHQDSAEDCIAYAALKAESISKNLGK